MTTLMEHGFKSRHTASADDLRALTDRIHTTELLLDSLRQERRRLLQFVELGTATRPARDFDRIAEAIEGTPENPAYLDEYEAGE